MQSFRCLLARGCRHRAAAAAARSASSSATAAPSRSPATSSSLTQTHGRLVEATSPTANTSIPGLEVLHEFASEEEEAALVAAADAALGGEPYLADHYDTSVEPTRRFQTIPKRPLRHVSREDHAPILEPSKRNPTRTTSTRTPTERASRASFQTKHTNPRPTSNPPRSNARRRV